MYIFLRLPDICNLRFAVMLSVAPIVSNILVKLCASAYISSARMYNLDHQSGLWLDPSPGSQLFDASLGSG